MPHSWKAYDTAKKIVEQLLEGKYIGKKYEKMVRGIIQIIIEEL